MSDALNVTPVILEDGTELKALSDADKWIGDVTAKATTLASKYQPHDIVDEADYKKSKSDRAEARKAIKEIDGDRKNKVSLIKKVLREFDDSTREALRPLSTIDDEYKAKIEAYDANRAAEKLAHAKDAYEHDFPEVAKVIPFALLDERFGRADGWHNRSTSEKKIVASMREHASACAADAKTIKGLPYAGEAGERIVDDALLSYYRTLDLKGALDEAKAKNDLRVKNEEIERERELAEEPVPVAESPDHEIADMPAKAVPEPAPFSASVPAPAPVPAPQAMAPQATEAPMGIPAQIPTYDEPVRHRWVITTDPITDAQKDALGSMFARAGISAVIEELV